MKLLCVLFFIRTFYRQNIFVDFDCHQRGEFSGQGSLGSLNSHLIAVRDADFNAGRNGNRLISDT